MGIQAAVFGGSQPFLKFGPHWWNWYFRPLELKLFYEDRLSHWLFPRLGLFTGYPGLRGQPGEFDEKIETILAELLDEVVRDLTGGSLEMLAPFQRIQFQERLELAVLDIISPS